KAYGSHQPKINFRSGHGLEAFAVQYWPESGYHVESTVSATEFLFGERVFSAHSHLGATRGPFFSCGITTGGDAGRQKFTKDTRVPAHGAFHIRPLRHKTTLIPSSAPFRPPVRPG